MVVFTTGQKTPENGSL